MNVVDPILFQCRRQPPWAAICVPGAKIELISYRRLEMFIHNISRRLVALGIPSQSVVAVSVNDIIFHGAIVLALMRLGMITLSLRASETLPAIGIDVLIADTNRFPLSDVRGILADMSWTEGDGQPLESHLLPQVSDTDLCRIVLTSGTTNEPKMVALSHRLLASRINRHLTVFGNRLGDCARIYTDVPLSSSLGFQFFIYALWRGGTVFFAGNDFQATLRAIEDYQVQALIGSPGGFENLLRWFETVPSYQSNVEVMVCGGDVLSRTLSDRLRSRICSHLVAAYGSTEASMSATAHAHEIAEHPRAVGFVTPGTTIQIIDSSGVILPPGQEGQLRIKSEYAVDGYFRNAGLSQSAFRDGWFYPGDFGILQADGLLTITGRQHNVLNLGGDKLNPELVEAVLEQFSGIAQAAVFGAPNAFGVDEISAAIVSRGGVDEAALRSHCDSLLPRGCSPVRYLFVESLPRNSMGKIDRRRLPDLLDRASTVGTSSASSSVSDRNSDR